MTEGKDPTVFLSYAREDVASARRIHRELEARGLTIWFDERDVGAGKWRTIISKAIASSRYFLICLSDVAIRKIQQGKGFQDEELAEAYQIALNQSVASFTIVPLRLSECGHGDHRLAMFNQFDLFDDWDGVLDRVANLMGGRRSLSGDAARGQDLEISQEAKERFATGVSLVLTGESERALKEFDAILKLYPKHAGAVAQRAIAHQQLGNYKKAIDDYDEALWLQPRNHSTRFNVSVLFFNVGDYASSLREVERALELYPASPDYHLTKAASLAMLDRCEEAAEECDLAVRYSEDPVRSVLAGYSYLQHCSFEQALALLERGIGEHPESWRLWYQKIKHPSIMADSHQSRLISERLIRLKPDVSYFWSLHAHMLSKDFDGDFKVEEAFSAQDKAIELAAEPAVEYLRKGDLFCLFAVLKPDDARDYYERAVASYDRGLASEGVAGMEGRLLHNKALALGKLGREDDAAKVASAAATAGSPVNLKSGTIQRGFVLR